MPMMAAGLRRARLQHLEQVEQRGRRVADGDHRALQPVAPQLERRGRAGGAELGGQLGHARIAQRADHLVLRRQPRAGDAMRHHLGVAQDRRAAQRARPAPPRPKPGANSMNSATIDQAAGMDHAHGDLGLLGREAREIGLGADDGEGALIDGGAVADIVWVLSIDGLTQLAAASA